MKIYFGLDYSPSAYLNLKDTDGIAFDSTVVNVEGLVTLLELHLGIHHDERSKIERQAQWMICMRGAMKEWGKCLQESWEKNALGVSNECLHWRDSLRMALWRNDMEQPNDRFRLIAEADKHFNCLSIGDRIISIIDKLKSNPFDSDTVIHVGCLSASALPASVALLLDRLEAVGIKVCYDRNEVIADKGSNLAKVQSLLAHNDFADSLSPDDSTFEVWEFPSAIDAYRYIASLPKDEFEVYVASEIGGKLLDNTQKMLGQPTSGTKVPNSSPQIAQMFMLGMNLFEYPLNIHNVLAWLQLPMHPIKSDLRHKLVKTIVETGGVDNDKYDEAITAFLASLSDEKEREKVERAIDIFDVRPSVQVKMKVLRKFNEALRSWASQTAMIDELDAARRSQLEIVATLCTTLDTLIADITEDEIPYRRLESAISTLYNGTEYNLYVPEQLSRHTVGVSEIVDSTDSVIWTDCYNYQSSKYTYDFLNRQEMEYFSAQGCVFQDADEFNRASIRALGLPILRSRKRCVLVGVKRAAGEDTTKHPLMIRIEESFKKSFAKVVRHPSLDMFESMAVDPVDNMSSDPIVHVDSRLPMPDRESYSSLHNLIQFPLDYVLEKVAQLYTYASTDLVDVRTIKGNVAHRMIEQLFEGNHRQIAENLEEKKFNDTLDQTIKEIGAVLLLPENEIECEVFRKELRECLEALLEIITENNLEVESREQFISTQIGLAEEGSDPAMNGIVDMVLRDRDGNLVIFDFKWTSARSHYQRLLTDNLSLQLALYRHMLQKETGKRVVATAYFTMPRHKLYTTSAALHGVHVDNVVATNSDDIVPMIVNAYRYRSSQFAEGNIENGEGYPIDRLEYGSVQEELHLFPLALQYGSDTIHESNIFTNYACFKSGLIK